MPVNGFSWPDGVCWPTQTTATAATMPTNRPTRNRSRCSFQFMPSSSRARHTFATRGPGVRATGSRYLTTMRILHVADRLSERGGADLALLGLLDALADAHESHLAVGRNDGTVRPPCPLSVVPGLDSRTRTGAALDPLLGRLRPDLVHVHNVVNPAVLEWAAGRPCGDDGPGPPLLLSGAREVDVGRPGVRRRDGAQGLCRLLRRSELLRRYLPAHGRATGAVEAHAPDRAVGLHEARADAGGRPGRAGHGRPAGCLRPRPRGAGRRPALRPLRGAAGRGQGHPRCDRGLAALGVGPSLRRGGNRPVAPPRSKPKASRCWAGSTAAACPRPAGAPSWS